ncbi:Tetratricopeptide repeat family protein [Flavobacterium anhuiense]|uniref:Tetratricopeptide repeat family protein n=1 Tax=Flavobacterium anhuiense TaxID=459526 RepID=A0A444VV08_9FLAO|nr:tetratricopeptide repeat protein [Flavobacterium anhuiense]RYJ37528.1 Tetratricopeptide repeat family protein [Flavobacterium anhuiense]
MRLIIFIFLAFTSLTGIAQEKIQKEINYIRSFRKESDRIVVELGIKPRLCFIPTKNNPNYVKFSALVQPYQKKENLYEIGIEEQTGKIKSLRILNKNETVQNQSIKPFFPAAVAAVSASQLPEKYYDEALELYNKEQYQEAIETVTKSIEINTQDPEYHQLKALCLAHLQQYKDSTDEAEYALEMDMANAELYELIANNYYFLKDNENAIKNFEKAIEYDINIIVRIYHNYIKCLIDIPIPQRAIEIYKLYKYRLDSPNNFGDNSGDFADDLEFYAGQAYQQIVDWGTAAEIYDRLIVVHPDVYGYRAQRGRLYQEKGEFPAAIRDFEIALKLDENENILLTNLAAIYQELYDYKKAEAAYNKYLSKNPDDAVQISNYGYLLLDEKRYKEAQIKFETSFKIDSTSIDTHIGRILAAYLLGDSRKKNIFIAEAKSHFPNIEINVATLNALIITGNYYYSEKIIGIWKEAVN